MKTTRILEGDDLLGLLGPVAKPVAPAAAPHPYAGQRRWERIQVKLHIRVSRKVQGKDEVTDGQAQEISEGGIGAYIPNTYEMNEQVSIEVVLPFGKKPFHFSAEVRDARGFRYGFEFIDARDGQREKLREALAAFAVKH